VKDLYGSALSTSVILEGQLPQSQFQIGVETAGILGYEEKDIETELSEIQRMRGSVVRVFVGNAKETPEESAKALQGFLNKAALFKISVIASLVNSTDRL